MSKIKIKNIESLAYNLTPKEIERFKDFMQRLHDQVTKGDES